MEPCLPFGQPSIDLRSSNGRSLTQVRLLFRRHCLPAGPGTVRGSGTVHGNFAVDSIAFNTVSASTENPRIASSVAMSGAWFGPDHDRPPTSHTALSVSSNAGVTQRGRLRHFDSRSNRVECDTACAIVTLDRSSAKGASMQLPRAHGPNVHREHWADWLSPMRARQGSRLVVEDDFAGATQCLQRQRDRDAFRQDTDICDVTEVPIGASVATSCRLTPKALVPEIEVASS